MVGDLPPPQADQYVQLPGGVDARLTIINPNRMMPYDATPSGPEGEITGDGCVALTVPALADRG